MPPDFRKMVCLVLVVVMVMGPRTVYAQQLAVASEGSAAGRPGGDLWYVTPKTTVAVVAHPRRVLTAPEMEMLPIEVISAAGIKELGIDPLEIEHLTAVAEPPREGPPQLAVVITFSRPQQMGAVLPPLMERTEKAKLNGRVYRQGKSPMDLSLYAVDRRTLIVAHDSLLRKLLAEGYQPTPGPMRKLLSDVGNLPDVLVAVVIAPIRPLVEQQLATAPLPPLLAPLKKLPGLLSSIKARANLLVS